ncbi:MAG: hypothetical protein QOE83_29 [Actinomycetota bacterium]|jgi:hypothetical protein|nr:hypothetical protein [Actinomycetota bacterium]
MYRMVWSQPEWVKLKELFDSAGNREAGAFLLVRMGKGESGARLLVQRVLLPPKGGLEREGRDFLRPSGQWMSGVIGAAIEEGCGLAFIHSHPNAHHPADLSAIDWETTITWSKSITPTIDGPFASLVWSPAGVAGVLFLVDDPNTPIRLDRFESLGDGRAEQLNPPKAVASDEALDDRQARALTTLGNRRLRGLAVGVVGAGGTGSPVVEQLVRMGVAAITIVDPDVLDDSSNLRRVVGSRPSDVSEVRNKAEVVGRHARSLDFETEVTVMPADAREELVTRRLLDCDLVMNTTDTQASRAFLNQVSYQYWIPVIDVGVKVGTKTAGDISGMPVELRLLLPDNGCLWCRKGVLDSQIIYEENLPPADREKRAADGYVQGVGQAQPSLTPLNYLAGALALLTLIRVYSGKSVPAASIVFDGYEQYVHPLQYTIDPSCMCGQWRGLADDLPIAFLPAARVVVPHRSVGP